MTTFAVTTMSLPRRVTATLLGFVVGAVVAASVGWAEFMLFYPPEPPHTHRAWILLAVVQILALLGSVVGGVTACARKQSFGRSLRVGLLPLIFIVIMMPSAGGETGLVLLLAATSLVPAALISQLIHRLLFPARP